jgi:hypothetical protein
MAKKIASNVLNFGEKTNANYLANEKTLKMIVLNE